MSKTNVKKDRSVISKNQFSQLSNPDVGKSYFFGIGINEYLHFPSLNNAVKDVKDIVTLFKKKYDFNEIVLLFDQEATRDNIITQLDRFVELVKPEDKLLIYYSGHGHLNPKINKGYWIPTDAEKDNTSHYLRNSTIRDYIQDIKSRHTFLISDSCFSGSLFVRGTSRSVAAIDELEKRTSRWALCSGRHDEQVYDGTPGANSPFADSILSVLRTNLQAKFNVSKLVDEVVALTRANYKQLPEGNPLYGVGHKGGQYVFRLKQDETNIWSDTQKVDTIIAYNNYLDQFPKGKYAVLALQRIGELEDGITWKEVCRNDRILDYRNYLYKFPKGKFTQEAKEKILLLEQQIPTNDLSNDMEQPERSEETKQAQRYKSQQSSLLDKKNLKWLLAGTGMLLLALFVIFHTGILGPKTPTKEPKIIELSPPTMDLSATNFDFGTISQGDKVSHLFSIKNTGGKQLNITDIQGDEGLTISDYPKVILPNEKGEVTLIFDSQNRTGQQNKKVIITGNATPKTKIFTLSGSVRNPSPNQSQTQAQTQIQLQPQAAFTIGNNNCTAPCVVSFINNSVNAQSYKWEFGDGQIDRRQSPTHRYVSQGSYVVKLRATASNNIKDFTQKNITILAPLVAKIEFETMDFDFGNIQQGATVSHTYAFKNNGNANLKLSSVTGESGCTITSWSQNEIVPNGRGQITVAFNSSGRSNRQNKRITVIANTNPESNTLRMKGNVAIPSPEEVITATWDWKRVNQLNIDDANNFLNGRGNYTQKVKNVEITQHTNSNQELIIFYQSGGNQGWGSKRVTGLNLEDTHNFLNGRGAYTRKVMHTEIVPIKRGSSTDLIIFYRRGGNQSWGSKKVTNLNMEDALNFLNGEGVYNRKIKHAEIISIKEGNRTDLIIFYQSGQPASSARWRQRSINTNNELKTFLGTTQEAEVITVGNTYRVFYK